MRKKDGALLVFEGIDGSGKSSAIQNLSKILKKRGVASLQTAEPSEGETGRKLREALHQGGLSQNEMNALFIADRKEHLKTMLLPALKRGEVVLCDRYIHSNYAYQGASGESLASLEKKNAFALKAKKPDVIFYFDLPVALALSRVGFRSNKEEVSKSIFEKELFLEKVRTIYKQYASDFFQIDASRPEEDVLNIILKELEHLHII